MKNNIQRIAILAGGPGGEREVSLTSARNVVPVLEKLGYTVIQIDAGAHLAGALQQAEPDIVFNCLHGIYGEDGAIPGLLEVMGIPYTHSGIMASAIAMNKAVTKKIAELHEVRTPPSFELSTFELFKMFAKNQHPMPFPYVVKPIQQGSTIGIYIMQNEASKKPTLAEWTYGSEVLIEQYIPGQELSAVVICDRGLGILELQPQNGFYDYEAKYTDSITRHIYPAQVPEEVYQLALKNAEIMHATLKCRSLSRSDFRYDPSRGAEGLFFLELNTHPGLTSLSILPEIAGYNGISFTDIVKQLIQDARCDLTP